MLMAAFFRNIFKCRLLQPVGKICFKPIAPFRTCAQISAGFPIDPGSQINPILNLFRTLAVPSHIFAQMTVGLRAVVTKTTQHIDPYLFCTADVWMLLEGLKKLAGQVLTIMFNLNIPGLMINTGTNNFNLFLEKSKGFGNLRVSVLYAVT
ncbi:hypothetical protein D3C75_678260 [compost metagenome]